MRTRLKAAFDRFIDVRPDSDEEAALRLHDLRVDIAVDLMGFTRDARTGILALRPAPVQVNYLGLNATMGADYIDYILADRCLNNQQGNPKDQQHGVDHVPHFSLLVTRSEATNHIGHADSPQSVSQRLFEKMTLMGLHREAVPSKLKGQHHDSDCGNPARNGATGNTLPIRVQSLQTHQKI